MQFKFQKLETAIEKWKPQREIEKKAEHFIMIL